MKDEIKRESLELPSAISNADNRPLPIVEVEDVPSYSGVLVIALLAVAVAWYKDVLPFIGAFVIALIAIAVWASRIYGTMREQAGVYRDGIIASRECGILPTRNVRDWYQLPWASIVHLDLTRNCFAVLYDGESGPGKLLELKKMSKAERVRVLTELRSYQQRGDIPPTVRIIDK